VKPSSLPLDEQAQCCWALANSYSAAASHLLQDGGAETFLPCVFLLLHALELHLKAFLISKGVSDKQLRVLGHDLLACLRACKEQGLGQHIEMSWQQLTQIARANAYYKEKELEYFVPQAKRLGNVERLLKSVEQLAKAVFNPITEKSFRALSAS
jgi:HEPN domain